jgi:hypothetical protein
VRKKEKRERERERERERKRKREREKERKKKRKKRERKEKERGRREEYHNFVFCHENDSDIFPCVYNVLGWLPGLASSMRATIPAARAHEDDVPVKYLLQSL